MLLASETEMSITIRSRSFFSLRFQFFIISQLIFSPIQYFFLFAFNRQQRRRRGIEKTDEFSLLAFKDRIESLEKRKIINQ